MTSCTSAAAGSVSKREQITRAAALFRRASRRWPLSVQMHLHYGIVLERLRRWRLARRAYEQAIALDAQPEEAYRLLALLLIDRGDAQAAIRLANALRRLQRSREPRTASSRRVSMAGRGRGRARPRSGPTVARETSSGALRSTRA